ncbi:Rab GTPase [Pelomyxa schiedti]|nr:Rab GTPase [Pelomyxa schiedti]
MATRHLYKILVIGDYAVGKTSIIKRYCEGIFTPNYKLTIGVDFAVKEVTVDDTTVTLQLWDIAGHERFGSMTRSYYKYAIAALIVYDLQRPATFEGVIKWKEDVDQKVKLANGENIPCLLIANKCDSQTVPNPEVLDKFVQDNHFIGWVATSAMNNTNIDVAMQKLAKCVLELSSITDALQPAEDAVPVVAPDPVAPEPPPNNGCC